MSRLNAVQTSGKLRPARVMIYGIEGVGKTSFASQAPKPIFITPEGGIDEINGAMSLPNISTFGDIKNSISELITESHDFQTLVLDSADWIEKLCHAEVIGKSGRSIITANGGYGAGYRESERLHRELIEDLSTLRDKRDMNIIVTAHYQVRTVKDPEAVQDYDAFEIKCHDMVSSLWREWVDCLLFARFKTYIKKDDEKDKGMAFGDGKRVMYTQKRPAYQAKNRYGLPAELDDVTWKVFQDARMKGREVESCDTVDSVKIELNDLWLKVSDDATKKLVKESVAKAGNDLSLLVAIKKRLQTLTMRTA